MAEKKAQFRDEVSETLLMTLYARAVETGLPDGLIRDERAVEIVKNLDCDFSHLKLQGHDRAAVITRMLYFDRKAREFLARNPDAVVVHFGCGLDTRFERVDDGRVRWYDLDLPDVIALRRKLIGPEGGRYHLLGVSAFDDSWLETVNPGGKTAYLFMAEGVLPYFEAAQVKALVLKLRERFPGAEIVCDAQTPFIILMDNLQLAATRVQARLHWGLKHGRDVESWGEDITMLDEWFYFDSPEPRMAPFRWMRHIPLLGKGAGVFHYRLGPRV